MMGQFVKKITKIKCDKKTEKGCTILTIKIKK